MNKVHLREGDQASGDTQERQSRRSTSIKVSSRIATGQILANEIIASDSGNGDGNARMSTGRFTGSYVERIWQVHSSQFAGMDISSVVPARSLRSPSVDFLSIYLDIHRVLSANFLDSIPTESYLTQWISDGNSFIEESNLGANEAQMKEIRDQEGPANRRCNTAITFTEETLRSNSRAEDVDSTGEEVATSRTINLRITHTSSLSRKVMR
ncbi:hypothetical protein GM51_2085 [freshwater metagenome]|uniref:Uncharacterized protein n=1 Tax=freshwater metagenome TaxID=449393 RepID=A0A094SRW3_9ZZZZ